MAKKLSSQNILNNGELLMTTTTFNNIRLSIYKISAKNIVNDLNTWAFNRVVDTTHVDDICNDLLRQDNPHLMGTIKMIFDSDIDKMQIIDGQHRISSLQKFFELTTDDNKDIDLMFEVYHVDSLNGDIATMLYRKANLNLNVDIHNDINVCLMGVVNLLCDDKTLSKGIIDRNNGSVNKPRISKKELYEAFKEHMRAQDMLLGVNEIVARVKTINKQLGSKNNLDLFGRKVATEKHRIQKAKADNIQFYLNLPGKFPPEKWIPLIGTNTHTL